MREAKLKRQNHELSKRLLACVIVLFGFVGCAQPITGAAIAEDGQTAYYPSPRYVLIVDSVGGRHEYRKADKGQQAVVLPAKRIEVDKEER